MSFKRIEMQNSKNSKVNVLDKEEDNEQIWVVTTLIIHSARRISPIFTPPKDTALAHGNTTLIRPNVTIG